MGRQEGAEQQSYRTDGTDGTMTNGWVEAPEEPLSEVAAEAYVASTCFKTGPPALLGLELEFVVVHDGDWSLPVDDQRVRKILDSLPPLPAAGAITLEPGGQVELSTRPAPDLTTLLSDAATDLAVLRAGFAVDGIELAGTGLDPVRVPRRVLDAPRYVEMERCFDRWGGSGRTMMCSTAAVQVTVDAGRAGPASDGYRARWDLLHEVGPALVAAFANSPYRQGRPTGWKSSRQQAWLGFDPSRTSAVHTCSGVDPREVYQRYALDAGLILVRSDDGNWAAPAGLTFRDWARGAWRSVPGLRAPTLADLEYHLTTLFPPVRARGPVEVRYVDAQDGDDWRVPAAVVTALLDNWRAGDEARAAAAPVAGRWHDAAKCGLDDPALARAALGVMTAARDGLRRLRAPAELVGEVEAYLERYTARGRSPADSQLQQLAMQESH
jgi:glutamate--cysteine ligase